MEDEEQQPLQVRHTHKGNNYRVMAIHTVKREGCFCYVWFYTLISNSIPSYALNIRDVYVCKRLVAQFALLHDMNIEFKDQLFKTALLINI